MVELHDDGRVGRGECVPYARYGESIDSVRSEIEAGCRGSDGANARARVLAMSAGAARNAVDCALWELEAKRAGKPVWELAGLGGPVQAVRTMRTVSVDTAEKMKAAAAKLAEAPVIKVKVDGGADLDRIAAVHEAAPEAELVIDANEAWSIDQLAARTGRAAHEIIAAMTTLTIKGVVASQPGNVFSLTRTGRAVAGDADAQ